MSSNKIGFIIVYAVSLGIMLYYNLTHILVNDGVYEYQAYVQNINDGWQFRYSLVNSCLVTTWMPALIQQWTGADSFTLFRVFPPIFYGLMPAFTFLIARRFLVLRYAIIAVVVVVLNSYIAYFPDIGRVGVAIGFFAGMIWALLEKKLAWAIIFAVLIVFSHYATSLIAVGFVGAVGFFLLVWKKRFLKNYLIVFCVLLVLIGVWHFGLAGYSGEVMQETLFQERQTGYTLPQYTIGGENSVGGALVDPTTREPAVQAAIGLNFSSMTTPQKIEVVANWLIVLSVTLGLYLMLRKKTDIRLKVMSLILWGLVVFTVAIPWLSTYYGGMRVFFTGMMVLSICFVTGAEWVANKIHVPPLSLMGVVLILYGLSTSGVIYTIFGMAKTFPVVISYP
jgi:uncharacterized membrane protein